MTKRNIKSNQEVIILYQLKLRQTMIVFWSNWLVLTRVGLVLIRVDSCLTSVDSCCTRLIRVDSCRTRVDSCWLVLIRVDLCWHLYIRIDLIVIKGGLCKIFWSLHSNTIVLLTLLSTFCICSLKSCFESRNISKWLIG